MTDQRLAGRSVLHRGADALAPRSIIIDVSEMEIQADIGVLPHERNTLQPLWVSVVLHLQPTMPLKLDQTIDYRLIVSSAQALAATHIDLIETYAFRLAEACLQHPCIVAAEVLVKKPSALSTGVPGVRVVVDGRPS